MMETRMSPVLASVTTTMLLPSSVLALVLAWLHPELNLHCK